jgi:DNA repair exonuclease SbcCD ATPase subunit
MTSTLQSFYSPTNEEALRTQLSNENAELQRSIDVGPERAKAATVAALRSSVAATREQLASRRGRFAEAIPEATPQMQADERALAAAKERVPDVEAATAELDKLRARVRALETDLSKLANIPFKLQAARRALDNEARLRAEQIERLEADEASLARKAAELQSEEAALAVLVADRETKEAAAKVIRMRLVGELPLIDPV